MRTTLISLAGAFMMLGAAAVHAQGMGMGAPDFGTLDADGDGELSAEELAALPFVQSGNVSVDQLMTNWDTDGSGSVSQEEFANRAMGMGGGMGG